MQAAIDQAYATIGGELAIPVAPAGEAWCLVTGDDPTIALWQADGSHPTAAGTYLAAGDDVARELQLTASQAAG